MGIYTAVGTGSDLNDVGNAFATGNKVEIKLNSPHPVRAEGTPYIGHLGALYVDITDLQSSATKITARISTSATGVSSIIVPDTEATLAIGIGPTTTGSATYSIDVPYSDLTKTDSVYVHFKTDTGTVDIAADAVRLTWSD
jgi:hypothetical protein